jgi:2-isopropylmalate synthase
MGSGQIRRKAKVHTFIATSDIHLKYKLKKSREEVLKDVVRAVKRARRYTDNVEFSAEGATRSDPEYLIKVVNAAIECGATTINIPDTVGYTTPNEYYNLIKTLRGEVRGINDVIISVHCHDDLGLSTSNSLTAVLAGARQVECTVNGIGERAGNTAMEEIVMSLKTRRDILALIPTLPLTRYTRQAGC